MKVLVIGAGAVGGYFGGRLAAAGHEVYFTARGRNLKALQKKGLRVSSIHGDFTVTVPARERFDPIPNLDLILFTVKVIHTDSARELLKEQLSPETVVISLQNGVESEELLAETVPPHHLAGGIAFIGANRYAAGKINHTASGFLTIGERDGQKTDRMYRISEAFEQAGVTCKVTGNLQRSRWEKLVWNNGFNAVAAITGCGTKALLADPAMRKMVRGLMEETVRVARANGHDVSEDMPDAQIKKTDGLGDVIPSMLQDVRAGRPTEIEFLNGKVVRDGERLGVLTPFNLSAYAAMVCKEKADEE